MRGNCVCIVFGVTVRRMLVIWWEYGPAWSVCGMG